MEKHELSKAFTDLYNSLYRAKQKHDCASINESLEHIDKAYDILKQDGKL
jgi:hypothetical protein